MKFFLLLNTFKVALQYYFNVFVLFNTVFYLILKFKLKIDPNMCTFKNLEEIWKPGQNLPKTFDNPVRKKINIIEGFTSATNVIKV